MNPVHNFHAIYVAEKRAIIKTIINSNTAFEK
jgi:hypothetical protein